MKVRQTIIDRLAQSRVSRLQLAVALDFSELWIDKLIAANKNNGPLTTAKAVQVITEEFKVEASEILEEETVPVR